MSQVDDHPPSPENSEKARRSSKLSRSRSVTINDVRRSSTESSESSTLRQSEFSDRMSHPTAGNAEVYVRQIDEAPASAARSVLSEPMVSLLPEKNAIAMRTSAESCENYYAYY